MNETIPHPYSTLDPTPPSIATSLPTPRGTTLVHTVICNLPPIMSLIMYNIINPINTCTFWCVPKMQILRENCGLVMESKQACPHSGCQFLEQLHWHISYHQLNDLCSLHKTKPVIETDVAIMY